MNNCTFAFTNSGDKINNDIILPGSSFITDNYIYQIHIKPQTFFWRFGLRFSKNSIVEFYLPDHRYKQPDFSENNIDIHLGVGEWDGNNWKNPNSFHLAQYNLKGLDHILQKIDTYTPNDDIVWTLDFDSVEGILRTSCASYNVSIFNREIQIPEEFKYFQFFAWADKTDLQLECSFEVILSKITIENNTPFKVGNLIFRRGDLFDQVVLLNTNIFLLPASSHGTATPHILNKASELGIPYPEKNVPGQVIFHPSTLSEKWCMTGYAYSVDGSKSSLDIIETLAENINSSIAYNPSINANCIGVALPLLGTGTGKLQHIDVAQVYDIVFNKNKTTQLIVNISDKKDFEKVRTFFEGKYTLVPELSSMEDGIAPSSVHKLFNLTTEKLRIYYNSEGAIEGLSFSNCVVSFVNIIEELIGLKDISFTSCDVPNFSFLSGLAKLSKVSLNFTSIHDFSPFLKLKNLEHLEINNTKIPSFEFVKHLKGLKILKFIGLNIDSLKHIEKISKLEHLNVNNNNLKQIGSLSKLKHLKKLYCSNNKIDSIKPITVCKSLEILDISNNLIQKLDPIIDLPVLNYLRANNNPYIEKSKILLNDSENHLTAVKNVIFRNLESDQIEIKLPVKILLLGNHGAGKTSLLDYILYGQTKEPVSSTHIIQVKKLSDNNSEIPKAIFFDFGGQDYYHGIYRAFLSGGSLYLVLWNTHNNSNNKRTDANGKMTQDFKIDYWLAQKKYLEQEKYGGNEDPIYLIQTFSDQTVKEYFHDLKFKINNYFFVNLTSKQQKDKSQNEFDKLTLEYLKNSVLNQIEKFHTTVTRPKWYLAFLSSVLTFSSEDNYLPREVDEFLPYYKRPGNREDVRKLLIDDFDQLHKQGIVLYYKDILPDKVWLNPVAVVDYVHSNILNKEKIGAQKSLLVSDQEELNADILQLLHMQKVLFYHEAGIKGPEYIIPNFLPLFDESESGSDLLIFGLGTPKFTIKCENFLPFGLINQLICFFGKLPEKKLFWRDRLLFTFEDKAKILIHVDLQFLEIKVYCSYLKNVSNREVDSIERYLFFAIIGQYWNLDIPRFLDFQEYDRGRKDDFIPESTKFKELLNYELLFENEACRPSDLYISRDDQNFILYHELCNPNNELMIQSVEIDENRCFTNKKKVIPTFQFQIFTNSKLKKRLKPVISYSKQDLDMVDKFRQYLTPLYDKGLIENPWFCTQLLAGQDWNEKIKKEFDEADIIFFMISENMMSTQYVKENEIKNAIDKYDRDEPILIVPILLVPYNFAGTYPYDLMRFSALPFSLKPVSEFNNQNIAWHVISETIRLTIERNLDPGKKDDPFYSALYKYFEKIIASGKIEEYFHL
jgi:internalin A